MQYQKFGLVNPLLLLKCFRPGQILSGILLYLVENLVASTIYHCASVAMGSQKGYGISDQAISNAILTLTWALL
ncbi:expressed protein, partial [Phakopsora pachyrhizi]